MPFLTGSTDGTRTADYHRGMTRRLVLLLLGLPLSAGHAALPAQTAIHHCMGADGTPVYTDQPCANLDATPVDPVSQTATQSTRLRMPHFCTADRDTLKSRVAEAFRRQDPNALAGLMLWHGYGRHGVTHTLRDLSHLIRRPFLGFAGTPETDTAMTGLPPLIPEDESREDPHALTLKLGGSGEPRRVLDIIHRAGCLWLRP